MVTQVVEQAWDSLSKPPLRIGASFVPLPYSEPMETFVIPQVQDIVQDVKQYLV